MEFSKEYTLQAYGSVEDFAAHVDFKVVADMIAGSTPDNVQPDQETFEVEVLGHCSDSDKVTAHDIAEAHVQKNWGSIQWEVI